MTQTSETTASAPSSKPWSLPVSLLGIAVGIPVLFRLKFGYVDGYSYGVAGFLMLLVLAVEYLPRKADEYSADAEAHPVAPGRFDFLGVIWLLSIPFAPFFGWCLTSAFDLSPTNWYPLLAARGMVCVVVPMVSVLPLIRYVRGKAATFAIAVLALGTAFPVLCGIDAAIDAVGGPKWQTVQVETVRSISFRTGAGTVIHKEDAFADLADGRTLRNAASIDLHTGSMELLVLPNMKCILGSR